MTTLRVTRRARELFAGVLASQRAARNAIGYACPGCGKRATRRSLRGSALCPPCAIPDTDDNSERQEA